MRDVSWRRKIKCSFIFCFQSASNASKTHHTYYFHSYNILQSIQVIDDQNNCIPVYSKGITSIVQIKFKIIFNIIFEENIVTFSNLRRLNANIA